MKQNLFMFLCSVLIFLSGCSGTSIQQENTPKSEQPVKSQQSQIDHKSHLQTQKLTATKSIKKSGIMPSRLQIPAIHLDTRVEPVGILSNGQMGVPASFSTVGILSPWTLAGEHGNAVIAGHLDHFTGPAVFYNLRNLKSGDKVIVSNEAGNKLIFTVKEVKAYKVHEAPLEKIFGKSDKSQLNLITCAGKYNKKTKEHAKRLVVFTELATPENQPPLQNGSRVVRILQL
ncbi:class F sortase [Aneurinibacillus sp. Ricciae_BoGa-3]|uniref:class F sortase n=1 Tax=Aneurinibacillus sp. Ricciae_BoGa-3 TaxID=3022697 RepID=UPI0023424845|nr:class F sortase [Aneurinibacillus sp. Ricciae_BoGa-3]WCK56344.1 class F sortase [Aneurinibacillus sp. Ricciae_BoGa-3]